MRVHARLVEKAFQVKAETAVNIDIVYAEAGCHHLTILLCNQSPDLFPHGCLSQGKRERLRKRYVMLVQCLQLPYDPYMTVFQKAKYSFCNVVK